MTMTDTKHGKLDIKDDSNKPGSASSSKGEKAEPAKESKSKKTKSKKTSRSNVSKKSSTTSATGGKRMTNGHVSIKDKSNVHASPKPGATPEPVLEKQGTSEELKVKAAQNGGMSFPAGIVPAGEISTC